MGRLQTAEATADCHDAWWTAEYARAGVLLESEMRTGVIVMVRVGLEFLALPAHTPRIEIGVATFMVKSGGNKHEIQRSACCRRRPGRRDGFCPGADQDRRPVSAD